MNGHALYWVSQTLWWLGWFITFAITSALLFDVWRSLNGESIASKKNWISPISFQRMTRISALVATFFLGYLFSEYRHSSAIYPIVEEHNVQVLSRIATNEWAMHSDEEGDFIFRGCKNFPNDTVITPGYIARRAMWQERGECKSIRDTGLGFWWRDKQNNYKEIR